MEVIFFNARTVVCLKNNLIEFIGKSYSIWFISIPPSAFEVIVFQNCIRVTNIEEMTLNLKGEILIDKITL